jgi:hypothetical protein
MSSPKVGGFLAYTVKQLLSYKQVPLSLTMSWLVFFSVACGTRVGTFCDAVRERDRRCIITGEEADYEYDIWRGFEAAHIFPPACEGHWKDNNYDQWITISPVTKSAGTINSVQNGMLLRNDIHALFDNYAFSTNPDVSMYVINIFEPKQLILPGQLQDCLLHTRYRR